MGGSVGCLVRVRMELRGCGISSVGRKVIGLFFFVFLCVVCGCGDHEVSLGVARGRRRWWWCVYREMSLESKK